MLCSLSVWLHQYRLRFVANSDNAVAEVGGVEVIRPLFRGTHAVVKYCCSMATQPFWVLTFRFSLSRMVSNLYFRISNPQWRTRRHGKYASWTGHRSAYRDWSAAQRSASADRRSRLQRLLAGILHAVTHVHRIATALQGEGFGEDVAGFVSVGQRDNELIRPSASTNASLSTLYSGRGPFAGLSGPSRPVAALRLVDKLRRGFQ